MKNYSIVLKTIQSTAIYVGIILISYLEKNFINNGSSSYVIYFLFLVLFLGLIKLSSSLFSFFTERFTFIKKLILGSEYIEGIWLNKAKDTVGIIRIVYKDESYSIDGSQYNDDGKLLATWRSTTLKFDGNRLEYVYNTHYYGTDNIGVTIGYAVYNFVRDLGSRVPFTFNGYFIDIDSSSKQHRFTSKKIIDKKLLKILIYETIIPKEQIIKLLNS